MMSFCNYITENTSRIHSFYILLWSAATNDLGPPIVDWFILFFRCFYILWWCATIKLFYKYIKYRLKITLLLNSQYLYNLVSDDSARIYPNSEFRTKPPGIPTRGQFFQTSGQFLKLAGSFLNKRVVFSNKRTKSARGRIYPHKISNTAKLFIVTRH